MTTRRTAGWHSGQWKAGCASALRLRPSRHSTFARGVSIRCDLLQAAVLCRRVRGRLARAFPASVRLRRTRAIVDAAIGNHLHGQLSFAGARMLHWTRMAPNSYAACLLFVVVSQTALRPPSEAQSGRGAARYFAEFAAIALSRLRSGLSFVPSTEVLSRSLGAD